MGGRSSVTAHSRMKVIRKAFVPTAERYVRQNMPSTQRKYEGPPPGKCLLCGTLLLAKRGLDDHLKAKHSG